MIIYRKPLLKNSDPRSTASEKFPSANAIKSKIEFNTFVTGNYCLLKRPNIEESYSAKFYVISLTNPNFYTLRSSNENSRQLA